MNEVESASRRPENGRGGHLAADSKARGYVEWNDIRAEFIERAGGEAAVAEVVRRHLAEIAAYRLAEKRKSLGMTQTDVAERMGITKGRVSQIERGEVSTVDVLARYSQALGGELRVIVAFEEGDQLMLGSSNLLSEAALDPEV